MYIENHIPISTIVQFNFVVSIPIKLNAKFLSQLGLFLAIRDPYVPRR